MLYPKISILSFIIVCLLGFTAARPKEKPKIKIACVGNSITYGDGMQDRENKNYPAQMAKILGAKWEIQNFGVNGATMLNKGNKPYQSLKQYKEALAYLPDVVIIKLGTNDSKPQNWQYRNEYEADYKTMINEFKSLSSKPKIWICLPVPAYDVKWGINDSIIKNDIIPLVKNIAKDTEVKLIDLYTPLSDKAEFFPDKIHPNAEGAKLIAETIAKVLTKSKREIRKGIRKNARRN